MPCNDSDCPLCSIEQVETRFEDQKWDVVAPAEDHWGQEALIAAVVPREAIYDLICKIICED